MELAYAVEKVVREDIPKLWHGTDGLIYTCAESGYVIGTDDRLYVFFYGSENPT
jgi:mRNA guanylyltransferase